MIPWSAAVVRGELGWDSNDGDGGGVCASVYACMCARARVCVKRMYAGLHYMQNVLSFLTRVVFTVILVANWLVNKPLKQTMISFHYIIVCTMLH